MISREELQRVKEYTTENKWKSVWQNIWFDECVSRDEDDNQRFLDLLEAAEYYAREDALKEVEDRLMPEGMAWPRFEDGSQLHFGDFVQFEDDSFMVDDVAFGVDKTVTMRAWAADLGGIWRDELWLSVKRPKPCDSWEKLEEDANKSACTYWDCPGDLFEVSCENCPSLIEGKSPRDFYGTVSCLKAHKLDIVARAKRLAEGGE